MAQSKRIRLLIWGLWVQVPPGVVFSKNNLFIIYNANILNRNNKIGVINVVIIINKMVLENNIVEREEKRLPPNN